MPSVAAPSTSEASAWKLVWATIGPSSVAGLRSVALGSTNWAKLPDVKTAGTTSASTKPGAISSALRAVKLVVGLKLASVTGALRRSAA